ncbi:MAG: hypothetical protein L3K03_00500 [Thermoplasmata archaeon]|nr:hypothetical protein [Thermoplasmata archaeon]
MRPADSAQREDRRRREPSPVVSFRQVLDAYAVERLQGALRMLLPSTPVGDCPQGRAIEIRRAVEVKR